MPNKKINQLDTRTGAALTDLILIGDPTSGTSFKLTATAFRTLLNNVPYTGATTNVNLGAFNLTAASIIRTGGTSSQFLKADGSVDSSTYTPTSRTLTINGTSFDLSADRSWTIAAGITGSGTSGQIAYWNGTSSQTGSNNLFWDAANSRLGIGTNAPAVALQVGTTSTSNTKIQIASDGFSTTSGLDLVRGGLTWNIINNGNFTIQRLGTTYLNIFTTGNLAINSTTDSGQRLQVMGDAFIKGSGNTSATNALLVQNSSSVQSFILNNAGQAMFGINVPSGGTVKLETDGVFRAWTQIEVGQFGTVAINTTSLSKTASGADFFQFINNASHTATSGTYYFLQLRNTVNPTSGSAVVNGLNLNFTINQTGGANGITRGLYVNPTLTAAADWRSIEWSNNSGWGLYGAGTAPNFLGGNTTIRGSASNSTTIFQVQNLSSANALTVRGDRSVLVEQLQVSDGLNKGFSVSYAGAGGYVFGLMVDDSGVRFTNGAGASRPVSFSMNTGEILRIDQNFTSIVTNNFLVGTTTNAGFKLDVQGTARVSGAVTFGNLINISNGVNSGLRYDSSNYLYVDTATGFILNSWDYTIVNNVSGAGFGGMLIRSGTTGAKQASAHLQVDSTTRGFLPPRLTTTQKNAIATPAAGLQVYDTTLNQMSYYNGTTWVNF
jgi:hypothetical protein